MIVARLSLGILFLGISAAPAAAQECALVPLEVPPSTDFLAAVEGGTRTATGEPGATS